MKIGHEYEKKVGRFGCPRRRGRAQGRGADAEIETPTRQISRGPGERFDHVAALADIARVPIMLARPDVLSKPRQPGEISCER
jgi:hypothetical protein